MSDMSDPFRIERALPSVPLGDVSDDPRAGIKLLLALAQSARNLLNLCEGWAASCLLEGSGYMDDPRMRAHDGALLRLHRALECFSECGQPQGDRGEYTRAVAELEEALMGASDWALAMLGQFDGVVAVVAAVQSRVAVFRPVLDRALNECMQRHEAIRRWGLVRVQRQGGN